jgi:hypothetical protein
MNDQPEPGHAPRSEQFGQNGPAPISGKKITAGYNGPPPTPINEARPTSPPPPRKKDR